MEMICNVQLNSVQLCYNKEIVKLCTSLSKGYCTVQTSEGSIKHPSALLTSEGYSTVSILQTFRRERGEPFTGDTSTNFVQTVWFQPRYCTCTFKGTTNAKENHV